MIDLDPNKIEEVRRAVLPETPEFVIERYASLADRAKTRSFGLIEEDVIILDTETTGLSVQENKLIEISAARLQGREVVDTFDTFVHPGVVIPPEITRLTSITNADVAKAPSAETAVAELERFVGGCPVVAHNATFDRAFVEAVKGGVRVSDIWIDSLALSRIALPRLRSHKLATMADLFGCAPVSHRSCDDVAALCGVWRILLCALSDLPAGLSKKLADMYPDVEWSYRPIFSYLAGEDPNAVFSLSGTRREVVRSMTTPARVDADELMRLELPSREEIEQSYDADGVVSRMYPEYEPRAEQVQMSLEVRQALETSTHRVIEAGTGVGKSIAYLLPFAEAAKRNGVTVGIATKSNNLADQLIYQELPKLSEEIPGGLSFCALKGYDHYPCLRKLERLSHGTEVHTTKDPADTLTAIAVTYAFVCQSPSGDLDGLGIRWRSVSRADFTTSSKECARRLCPFFPDGCLVHGARRRAARADVVVTNHSLLFRNVAANGRILPPIRHWVVDEAHSIEAEARRQWAVSVSADESKAVFEQLGGERSGELGRVARDLAKSDSATLYMGLTAKAAVSVSRASLAMAELFEGVRDLARGSRGSGGYDNSTTWIGKDLRESAAWKAFAQVGEHAISALDEAGKNLESLVETVAPDKPEAVAEVSDGGRRLAELRSGLELIVCGEDDRYVYSIQVNNRLKAGGEALIAERLDIGEALAEQWLPEVHTAIFTSATMAVAGNFDHFNHAVGLDRLEPGSFKALQLSSSYDFERNMTVVVTGDIPDPRNREQYLDALETMLVDIHIAMEGSTLTLFTNRRDMEDLYRRVEPKLANAGLELACQLRNSSVRRLREHFIQEKASSLFALKAFWEGFDASGDTLRCVVIPKLPFSNPTEPISREREARESRAAWARYSLPEAVLEVKQAAGRLIRSSKDSGVLVLADSRLVTKGYGKQFLKSLPASYQQISSDQVGRYITIWRKSHERR